MLPRLEAYIAQLPGGLDGLPDVRAKASIHRIVGAFAGTQLHGLPAALRSHVDNPVAASKWIPACHSLALVVALVEAQRLEGAAEGEWIRAAAAQLFESPMYRILMWAASPRMIMKGANVRWGAFFRGCELHPSFRPGEHTCDLVIHAPDGLFNVELASIFTDVLRAAMSFTEESAKGSTLDLVDLIPGKVRYVARW